MNLYKILLALALMWTGNQPDDSRIDLSGPWRFAIDAEDQGITQRWYDKKLEDILSLPGSMASNGKGNDITLSTQWIGGIQNPNWYEDPKYAPYFDPDDIQFPFWLQPNKKYTGAAWYQKQIQIPETWDQKVIFLSLERCHWESNVWIDGHEVGMQNSLSTSHRYNLTTPLTPGKHTISIRIDNRLDKIDPGINSHSITDHTQSNWNGIVGDLFLEARGLIHFSNIQTYPKTTDKSVMVKSTIMNYSGQDREVEISGTASGKNFVGDLPGESTKLVLKNGENTFEKLYNLGENIRLWDEFQPNLYEMTMTLEGKEIKDEKSIIFGFRDIETDNRQLVINGRRTYLRGTLECAIFPKTGYPSMDIQSWKHIYQTIQAYGLNHMRFHSWCPPKAAFIAADEMGVYLQVECGSWANQSTTLGDEKPIDQFVWSESKRIVEQYGNHPSFLLLAYGNEPGGDRHKQYLAEFVSYWKDRDPRRLYTSGAGWPAISENDYHNIPQPRIQGWGEGLKSIINAKPPSTDYDWSHKMPNDRIPVISHEIGQWCVYPNFKEIDKYTGVLKAKNFQVFQKSLEAHHLTDLAEDFLLASGKLQALCYKADIEAALRTPNQGGFQLLDLHDFPGQGTALVGVLDPFWDDKGYITAEEYSRFCNTTVPLVRLPKRIFTEGERLIANIEVAHFGPKPLREITPTWTLKDESGNVVRKGSLRNQEITIGNGSKLGSVSHTFKGIVKPQKLILEVSIDRFVNSWDIWLYPRISLPKTSVTFRHTQSLDGEIRSHLQNGGKVLLSIGKGSVSDEKGGEIGVGFSSIFWNTAWTNNQKPHTLGILCDPTHPALEHFPTEYHSNWQWWDAMSHSDVVILDDLSPSIKPIVRVIDDWVTNRSLGLIFEVQVGRGKLLICGVDLTHKMEIRPEARQLLHSLSQYIESEQFNPEIELSMDAVKSILK